MDVIPNDQYILELILLVWASGSLVIIITQARNTKMCKSKSVTRYHRKSSVYCRRLFDVVLRSGPRWIQSGIRCLFLCGDIFDSRDCITCCSFNC